MQAIFFKVGDRTKNTLRLFGIAIAVVVMALLMFGLVSTGVDGLIDAITTTVKTSGGVAVMLAPVGFIKLQKMGVC